MKRRVIKSGVEGRKGLAEGAKKIAQAVGSTFGPYGHNWFLDPNKITNDGVTVAREFQLPDEMENRGAAAIREAAVKTVEEVGDGTSTAILLAHAIYESLAKFLPKENVAGKKPAAELARQVERERKEITEKLIAMSTPIETEAQLIDSARVSTEDEDLGALIGGAQFQIGKEGYLLAEQTSERVSSVEMVKGIRIDNGFGTSQVVNNEEKQTLELEEVRIVLTSFSIKSVADWQKILGIYDKLIKSGASKLVVIARAWTDQTVNFSLQNINKGAAIYPLSGPYIDMQERFKDLAAVTGATFYDSEAYELEDMQLSDIGFAKLVRANRYNSVTVGADDEATKERVAKRLEEVKQKLAGSTSDFEKKQLTERIAQLENGFGIIKIGSPSDLERRRLFDKADDAVNAVRAAFQEGTVPGAGLAFKTISDTMPEDSILKRPLLVLHEQIRATAPADFVVEDWVRDPVKVLRVSLEKACAAACALATAGGVITEKFPTQMDEMFRQSPPVNNEGE